METEDGKRKMNIDNKDWKLLNIDDKDYQLSTYSKHFLSSFSEQLYKKGTVILILHMRENYYSLTLDSQIHALTSPWGRDDSKASFRIWLW